MPCSKGLSFFNIVNGFSESDVILLFLMHSLKKKKKIFQIDAWWRGKKYLKRAEIQVGPVGKVPHVHT